MYILFHKYRKASHDAHGCAQEVTGLVTVVHEALMASDWSRSRIAAQNLMFCVRLPLFMPRFIFTVSFDWIK